MLFFLAALFHGLLYSINGNEQLLSYCVVFAPKLPQRWKGGIPLEYVFNWLMLGSSLWLLFLFWNLRYLALATGIMFVLTVILNYRNMIILDKERNPFQRISLYEVEN